MSDQGRIRIKAKYREEPDLRRLARSLIELAIADLDAADEQATPAKEQDSGSEAA